MVGMFAPALPGSWMGDVRCNREIFWVSTVVLLGILTSGFVLVGFFFRDSDSVTALCLVSRTANSGSVTPLVLVPGAGWTRLSSQSPVEYRNFDRLKLICPPNFLDLELRCVLDDCVTSPTRRLQHPATLVVKSPMESGSCSCTELLSVDDGGRNSTQDMCVCRKIITRPLGVVNYCEIFDLSGPPATAAP